MEDSRLLANIGEPTSSYSPVEGFLCKYEGDGSAEEYMTETRAWLRIVCRTSSAIVSTEDLEMRSASSSVLESGSGDKWIGFSGG